MLLISLQAGASNAMSLLMMALIFIVFFFFFIRPQMKRQKEQLNFQNNLKKGDNVVTTSGMIGKINKIDDREVTLDLDGKTFIRFTKGAISKEMTESFFSGKDSTPTT